jgi:hypothetical protein
MDRSGRWEVIQKRLVVISSCHDENDRLFVELAPAEVVTVGVVSDACGDGDTWGLPSQPACTAGGSRDCACG